MFLESQRSDKKIKMAGHDRDYEKRVINHENRKTKFANYEVNSQINLEKQFSFSCSEDIGMDSEKETMNKDNNNDKAYISLQPRKTKKDTITLEIPTKIFKSPDVVSMIDRTGISSRKAVGLTAAILKSAGADLTDFTLSQTQVQKQRDDARSVLAQDAFEDFQAKKPEHAVPHWDSKLIDSVHGTKAERLSVLVSGAPPF